MTSDGRDSAIEDLIVQHHALLYRYAFRLCGSAVDADDLTQQTYLIAHEKLPQLRNASSAKSWLCTILRHAYLRLSRKHPPLQSLELVDEPRQRDSSSSYDEEALQQALDDMPEEYRSAVILFYFQELSYKEIADVLEIPLGTVMSRLSRGKALLKAALERREWHASPSHSSAATGIKANSSNPRLIPAFPN
jgi:RNA polymerase sigma-70 factor (ECF subfamily)